MDKRIAFWITFIATVAACFLFGLPFTRAVLQLAVNDPTELSAGVIAVLGVMYFGLVWGILWRILPDKREGQREVQWIAVGMQVFGMFAAFSGSYDDHIAIALFIPALIAGLVVLGFWVMRDQARRRAEENPID